MCSRKLSSLTASPPSYLFWLSLSLYPSVPLCPTPSLAFVLSCHFPPCVFLPMPLITFGDMVSPFLTILSSLSYFINFSPCLQLPLCLCRLSSKWSFSFSSSLSASPMLLHAAILSRFLCCVEIERIAELRGAQEGWVKAEERERNDRESGKRGGLGWGHWKGWHWLGQLAQGVRPGVLFWEGLWPLGSGRWVMGCLDPSSRQLGMGAIITAWLISTERKSLFFSFLGRKRRKVFVLLLLLV